MKKWKLLPIIPGQLTLFDIADENGIKEIPVNKKKCSLAYIIRSRINAVNDKNFIALSTAISSDDYDKNAEYIENEIMLISEYKNNEICKKLSSIFPEYTFRLSSRVLNFLYIKEVFRKKNSNGSKKKEPKKADLTVITASVPKAIRNKTERYINEPFSMDLKDAFKRAAEEYKKPSAKLRRALETGNFREFIPSVYENKPEKIVVRKGSDYSFKRHIEQRVTDNHGEHVISKIEPYYTFFTDGKVGTPHDIRPLRNDEHLESLENLLEYEEYRLRTANDETTKAAAKRNKMIICEKISTLRAAS